MFEKVLKICEQRKINLYQLSRGTGIAYSCLFDYKTGRSKPKVDKLKSIADFLEVDLQEII